METIGDGSWWLLPKPPHPPSSSNESDKSTASVLETSNNFKFLSLSRYVCRESTKWNVALRPLQYTCTKRKEVMKIHERERERGGKRRISGKAFLAPKLCFCLDVETSVNECEKNGSMSLASTPVNVFRGPVLPLQPDFSVRFFFHVNETLTRIIN